MDATCPHGRWGGGGGREPRWGSSGGSASSSPNWVKLGATGAGRVASPGPAPGASCQNRAPGGGFGSLGSKKVKKVVVGPLHCVCAVPRRVPPHRSLGDFPSRAQPRAAPAANSSRATSRELWRPDHSPASPCGEAPRVGTIARSVGARLVLWEPGLFCGSAALRGGECLLGGVCSMRSALVLVCFVCFLCVIVGSACGASCALTLGGPWSFLCVSRFMLPTSSWVGSAGAG